MIIFDNLDLVVRDVPAAVAFFAQTIGVVPEEIVVELYRRVA
jgi:hypothetical protein